MFFCFLSLNRRYKFHKLLGPMAALLLLPASAQAFILPVTVQGETAPARLEFGLSQAELARAWNFLPWPEKEDSASLLPVEILSAGEIELFARPFLTRFVFERPQAGGRLIGLRMVRWEKGAKDETALTGFIAALNEVLGAREERIQEEENDSRLSSWRWPGVFFSCRQDGAGQTWYLSVWPTSSSFAPDFLPELPLGRSMAQLEPLLQPYFEPGLPWPARPLRQNQTGLLTNGIALSRSLFLFAGYRPQDGLTGILLIFPALPASAWQEAALEDLREELSLRYGPCRSDGPDRYRWENKGGSLSLSRQADGSWRLLGLSSAAPADLPSAPADLLPPGERDLTGWDKFQWHMPLDAALDLCPPGARTGMLAYGQERRFIFSRTRLNNLDHGLRLSFNGQGLYEIMLSYDGPGREGEGGEQETLLELRRLYGDFDWRREDGNEQIFCWSRAGGYLEFTNFKTSGRGWRLVFSAR